MKNEHSLHDQFGQMLYFDVLKLRYSVRGVVSASNDAKIQKIRP